MPTELRKPRSPAGLGPSGRRFWREIVREYALDAGEERELEAACREIDEVDRLQAVFDGLETLEVPGYRGQVRIHPVVAELRQHRAALSRHIARLALPRSSGDSADASRERSHNARILAFERWGRRSV